MNDGPEDPKHSDALDLLAGPFCNVANAAALGVLADMGFKGAYISPELPADDILALPRQSPLPLGMVLGGFWPVGISRFGLLGIKPNEPFMSPKGEVFWARQYGGNVWLYPGWPLDLTAKRQGSSRQATASSPVWKRTRLPACPRCGARACSTGTAPCCNISK